MNIPRLALIAIRLVACLDESDAIAFLRNVKQAYPVIFAELIQITCAMEVNKPSEPGRYAIYANQNLKIKDI